MINDIEYHMQRSRSERDLAYRYGTGVIADAHMGLSELHLQRALTLRHVQHEPLDNVTPIWRARERSEHADQRKCASAPAG
jgi:hypothetical protein